MSWKMQKVLSWWISTSLCFKSLNTFRFFQYLVHLQCMLWHSHSRDMYTSLLRYLEFMFLIQTIRYDLYFDNFDRDQWICDLFWYLPMILTFLDIYWWPPSTSNSLHTWITILGTFRNMLIKFHANLLENQFPTNIIHAKYSKQGKIRPRFIFSPFVLVIRGPI